MYIIKPNKFNIPTITYDYNDYIYKYNLDGIYTYIDDPNIIKSFKPNYIKASRRHINGLKFGFKVYMRIIDNNLFGIIIDSTDNNFK